MVSERAILRGVGTPRGLAGTPGAPVLLERTDANFIDGVLAGAAAARPLEALSDSRPSRRGADGVLELFQPVHRAFHLAVLDVVCDVFGQPRLDPRKIESAGLVVRRLTADGRVEGWMRAGARVRGWVRFPAAAGITETGDPDPARRPDPMARFGLQKAREAWAESVSSLFTAPPAVCEAGKRTVLFGVLPLASAEVSDVPLDADAQGVAGAPYTLEEISDPNHLPRFFQAGTGFLLSGIGGRTYSAADATPPANAELAKYVQMLQQLQIELDAFGTSAESRALYAALDQLQFSFPGDFNPLTGEMTERLVSAAEELKHAAQVLVLNAEDGDTITLPLRWPAVSKARSTAIAQAALASLNARIGQILPREGRFEDPAARYHVRAFVRLKRDDGCPPAIFWSAPSEPFRILPWFENGAMPPLKISLPDLDRDSVKKLKPNVTFKVPGKLFNMLNQNKPKDLLDGNGKEGVDAAIAWICGFNIPIITICAFILLFIVLSLLNIIFWWLPFVKICFPIPASLKKRL